jgi:DNA polymerase
VSVRELPELVRGMKNYLSHLAEAGEWFAPRLRPVPSPPRGTPGEALNGLRAQVLECVLCGELARTRKTVVFGAGSDHARLVFVGEAPGHDEDLQGLPFVGKAGQLLTKMIEAMGLRREDVFIMNVLKCRPPGNRNPLPGEIMNCEPYLVRQIEILRPQVICALGNFAAQVLLRSDRSISHLRGRFYDYRGIKVLPTFHPAYLLRNPAEKRKAWEDMKLIMAELGPASLSRDRRLAQAGPSRPDGPTRPSGHPPLDQVGPSHPLGLPGNGK